MGEANCPRAISPATSAVEALGDGPGQPATAELRASRQERQGRVTVESADHPDGRRAVIARCARCRSDLSGANDVLSLAFLLDVGSDHDCA